VSTGNGKAIQESRLSASNRWRKEKRDNEVALFRQEVKKELAALKIYGLRAKEIAWNEAIRRFPPLPKPQKDEEAKPAEQPPVEIPEVVSEVEAEADAEAVEKMLEKMSPVDFFADIRWVYSQLANKRVRAEQAPSSGAWKLLEWARKYESRFFEQLLPKALAKAPDEEVDLKRETRRIEDIEAMISKLSESD